MIKDLHPDITSELVECVSMVDMAAQTFTLLCLDCGDDLNAMESENGCLACGSKRLASTSALYALHFAH